MTGNLTLLCNFVEKYLGTVHFGNDQFAPILGYGDLVQGNIMINRVYYVEGLNHNLFSVGQFCDADLEVAFRKSTCFVRDLQGSDLSSDHYGPLCEVSLLPQRPKKASAYDTLDPAPGSYKCFSFSKIKVPAKQKLDLLFSVLCSMIFLNDGTSVLDKSALPPINSTQQDHLNN
ncbi:hypothetical protein Tco_0162669 [Tanacetum coccineum]